MLRSTEFPEVFEFDLTNLPQRRLGAWCDYVVGVALALGLAGIRVAGVNLLVHGEVPMGSGLSSSAAIEVATALALLRLSKKKMPLPTVAKLCQQAENEFVGARVGIMDQFVSCFGRASHALLLDCRSLKHEFVQLPANLQLVICNTMVGHELASGEYNARRAECEEGVRILRIVLPEVRALRDVTLSQLEDHRQKLSLKVFARCRHVITENARVKSAVEAFHKEDTAALGPLLRDSHRSLRDDYEVSCKELDLMVEIATAQPGLIGARMTGGGFGGCTINLVESAAVNNFRRNVGAAYSSKTGLTPEIYVSPASEGAQQIVLEENKPAR